ncbi:MAG: hypothetical protein JJT90_04220 [Ectothiorhodospiraceae bacterium]|nr:hypothetical protein [Ectothiorhodospiraceae bacterium]
MIRPEFLYHGSREYLEVLEPRQAVGFGGRADCQRAVYAVALRELAVPFAMTFVPTGPDAAFSVDTDCSPPRVHLRNTRVMWNAKGYLYVLPADTFERIDDRQWVSYSPVRPVMVEEIEPADFRAWVLSDQV